MAARPEELGESLTGRARHVRCATCVALACCAAIGALVRYQTERAVIRLTATPRAHPALEAGMRDRAQTELASLASSGSARAHALERGPARQAQPVGMPPALRTVDSADAPAARRGPRASPYAANLRRAALTKARARPLPVAPPDVGLNATRARAWCEASSPPDVMVSCARVPPCAINEAQHAVLNEAECTARKRYAEWPMHDPHLPALREGDARIVQLVERLGARTMLIAGDSVSNLDFRALRCAIQREELYDRRLSGQMLGVWRAWGRTHGLSCCGQMLGTLLGGRIVFVGIYRYDPKTVALLLQASDILLINYGLHYRHTDIRIYAEQMRALFAQTNAESERGTSGALRAGTRVLFRETTAQHFKGTGAYMAGAERIGAGGCVCAAHTREVSANNHVASENEVVAELAANVTRGGVQLVPFYALTAPRFNLHNQDDHCGNGALAARTGAQRARAAVGSRARRRQSSCCDCTHFCYTPQLYDAYFAGVESALARADARASAGFSRRGSESSRRRSRGRVRRRLVAI